MDGAEVDYVDGLHGAGFKFNNPNATGSRLDRSTKTLSPSPDWRLSLRNTI
jgi:Fe-S cluster assembly iron-binding protein IscA